MAQPAVGRGPADGSEGATQLGAVADGGVAIVALRVQARLPLNDVYIALKDVIPHRTRSSLHRCLQRHGISRLPKVDREKPKKFRAYEIGYFHIDIAELRYEGGKAFLYAVDRTSKLVFARIYRSATKLAAVGFLKVLVKTVPYRIHTVLTDNPVSSEVERGVQFVQPQRGQNRGFLIHIFERVCLENGIEHRLTKPYHPWTNGQAERMVRTIKEATVKSFHYASINELRRQIQNWLTAYNFAKQLKALRFKTPYQAIEELQAPQVRVTDRDPRRANGITASGTMHRTNRSDTWPHQPALQSSQRYLPRRAAHTGSTAKKRPCKESTRVASDGFTHRLEAVIRRRCTQ